MPSVRDNSISERDGSSSTRFTALDSLRGICALMVAAYHFPGTCYVTQTSLVRNSWLFVDFFFVLSGFIISYGYRARLRSASDFWSFMRRRFARVWPMQAFTLIVLVVVELLIWLLAPNSLKAPFAIGSRFDPLAIPTNLLLLNAFDLHDQNTWNIPSWSIGAEFYTYALFGLACIVLQRRTAILHGALVVLAATILATFAPDFASATFDFGFVRCVYGFFVGCLAFPLFQLAKERDYTSNTALEGVVIVLVVTFVAAAGHGFATLLGPLVFSLAVLVFAFQAGKLSSLLCLPALRKLGLWSYSIYMVHYLLVDVVRGGLKLLGLSAWVRGDLILEFVLILFLVATIAVAALTYRFIEEPCRAYLNRLEWGFANSTPATEKIG